MEYILIVLLGYVGLVLSNVFFLSNERIQHLLHRGLHIKDLALYVIPLLFYKYLQSTYRESRLYLVAQGLGFVSGILFGMSVLKVYTGSDELVVIEIFAHFSFYAVVYCTLLYLAIFDMLHFAIPAIVIKRLVLFVLVFNSIVAIVKFLYYRFQGEHIWEILNVGSYTNLLGALFLVFLTWIVVKMTSEEGLGEGDVDVNLAIGLTLGWPNVVVFLLSTLIIGSGLSIALALYLRRYKKVLVPFVPFILLGFSITVGYGDILYDALFVSI